MRENCTICGEEYLPADLYSLDNRLLCAHCLSTHTLTCTVCGDRLWTEDNAGSPETPLCQDCYDDHYTHCTNCHELIHLQSDQASGGGGL